VKRAHLEAHVLVLVTLGLVAFGLVMVYSATSAPAAISHGDPISYLKRQAAYAIVGFGLLLLLSRMSYRSLRRLAPTLVATALVLCLAVLVIGTEVNGARRWLSLGPAAFQPSELTKLALAIWTAAYLARKTPRDLRSLARPVGLLVGLFCVLLLLEPDLGTAITIVLMVVVMLAVGGVPARVLAAAGSIALTLGLLAIWFEPYRRARLFSFIHPWHDAQGSGFQTVQAMIGLGSGGVLGVGLGQGVEKIFYLPEAHTDMILAVIGEELGLLGTAAVIAAFAAFAWTSLSIALACRDPFGKHLAVGLTALVCGQAAINFAAVLGLAPLTGIPLPFVSYGGSNLVIALCSVGVLLNIAANGSRERAPLRDRDRRHRRPRVAVAGSGGGTERARRAGDVRRVARSRRSAAGP
jgi:cell division protein FtsW